MRNREVRLWQRDRPQPTTAIIRRHPRRLPRLANRCSSVVLQLQRGEDVRQQVGREQHLVACPRRQRAVLGEERIRLVPVAGAQLGRVRQERLVVEAGEARATQSASIMVVSAPPPATYIADFLCV